jgi:hypothetical protein
VLPDAPAPLVGRTTLTAADGAVLVKASQARFGFFNQPRISRYCALAATMAAIFCLEGYDLVPKVLLAIAVALYLISLVVAVRTTRRIGEGYGRGQEREIALDDAGVTVREPGMTIVYAWSRFDRAIRMPEHLALMTGAGVVLLPARAFAPDAFARVRELVAAKVPEQARA